MFTIGQETEPKSKCLLLAEEIKALYRLVKSAMLFCAPSARFWCFFFAVAPMTMEM